MGRRKVPELPPTAPLRMRRDAAAARLDRHIRRARESILRVDDKWVDSEEDLVHKADPVESRFAYWHETSQDHLDAVFEGSAVKEWYTQRTDQFLAEALFPDSEETTRHCIASLKRIIDRLPFCEEPILGPSSAEGESASYDKRKVFVVHGHDSEAELELKYFLKTVGLQAVVLHEQTGGGTWLDRLYQHSDVGFAVVLLTPDDVGAAERDRKDGAYPLKPRARQNVIFELGFFIAKLGSERVRALRKGDVEILSDYPNVYIEMDEHGAWKLRLAAELESQQMDLNKSQITG